MQGTRARGRELARAYTETYAAWMAAPLGGRAYQVAKDARDDAMLALAHWAACDLTPNEFFAAARTPINMEREVVPVPAPVSVPEAGECAIGCLKATHCEGCDQCEPTTRMRIAHGRPGVYLHSRVLWCDGCTELVNRGEHDEYASVTDLPGAPDRIEALA